MLELRISRDRGLIDIGDDIERLEIAFCCRRVAFNRADDYAFIETFEQIANRRIVAECFDSNPEPRAHDLAAGD